MGKEAFKRIGKNKSDTTVAQPTEGQLQPSQVHRAVETETKI